MIVEMRTYRTRPGSRERFLEIFRTRSMPAHAELGMPLLGPWPSVEDPDVFFFMRGFADLGTREARKAAFYEGELWTSELEQILMPMLASYEVVVVDDSESPIAWPAGSESTTVLAPAAQGDRDGSQDFDFELGTWTTHVRLLRDPLSGSTTWSEYDGTSVVRPVLKGRANLVELDVEGPAGRIEGASLRLYDPAARQWSLNFFNGAVGRLTPPVVGGFNDGRGTFYGSDDLDGRAISVRFEINPRSPDECVFEQAFSADGGRTWETNWVATDTRA